VQNKRGAGKRCGSGSEVSQEQRLVFAPVLPRIASIVTGGSHKIISDL
jgi:hypothetical protein